MSFNIRAIREISDDPTTKFLSHVAKKISDFANAQSTQDLENKEDIYSNAQDVDAVVKLHSDLTSTKNFEFDKEYYPPTEPDLDTVQVWLKGYNMGNELKDWSGFDNINTLNGDPILIDGTPFDYGIHDGGVKSICLRFNRPSSKYENQEYITVDDRTELSVDGMTTGISYFIRFKLGSIEDQNGASLRLFEKTDGPTPNNAVMVHVTDTGRLRFILKRGGVEYSKETAAGTIAINTVYDVFFTFSISGTVQHIYVNNVDKTLTDYVGAVNWHTDLTDTNLNIFRRGEGSDSGYVYGDLYDYTVYMDKIVSAAEVGYHYTNKWTIADIPFGQVMVSDY